MNKAYGFEKLAEAIRAAKHGDWDTVEKIASYEASMGAEVLRALEHIMPAEVKRSIALYHYDNQGDLYPIIRKHVRSALKARPEDWRKELPESVRHLDSFTVYRGGAEPLDKAKNMLSWTLSRDVAEWFANRHIFLHQPKQHIYRATISADDVIAFLNDRNEYEIVQYRRVKNIEEVPMQGYSMAYQEYLNGGKVDSDQYMEYFNTSMGQAQCGLR